MRRHRLLPSMLVLIALIVPLELAAVEPSSPFLEQCVERFQAEGSLDLGDARLAAARLIPMLCERFEFQPAWTDRTMVEQLLDGVRGSTSHGLDPADYHLRAIESRPVTGNRRTRWPAPSSTSC